MPALKNLKKIDLFKNLSDAELKELAPYLVAATFRKKEEIFSEGDQPEWFYIVSAGKVKITKLSHEGKEIILELISPTDIFGGVAVLRNFPYPANAVAMEDTEVIKISRKNLMRLVDRFPNLMYCIALQLGDRMKSSYDSLKNIALERVEARIAALLLKLAGKVGIGNKRRPPHRHEAHQAGRGRYGRHHGRDLHPHLQQVQEVD